uniref:CSON008475 protein n=1 Tax=Culicoides sonorensis TaxID=179676 RepID=A0A336LJY0_CULSO
MSQFNQKEKYWYGPELNQNPIYNSNNGIGDIILAGLKNNLDKISQISDNDDDDDHAENTLTCKEILDKSICVAHNLSRLGFKQGDVFSIITRNNANVAPIVFGTFFLGATLNTLDVTLDENDLLHIFETVKPKLVFADPIVIDNVKICLASLKISANIIIFDKSYDNFSQNMIKVTTLFAEPEIISTNPFFSCSITHPSQQIALILCSSGITGPSKMICLSHSQVISEVLRTWDWSITSSDRCFTFSSLFWVSGIANLLISTVKGACRVITTQKYSAELLFKLISKHKITQLCLASACIPDVLSYHKKLEENFDISSLNTIIIGGSMILDQTKDEFRDILVQGTKVVEVYGFIELGSITSNTLYGTKKGSIGIVAAQNLVKIINEKGKNLGPGEIGEICAKNNSKFLGYYNNDALTKETVDSNGWIRSGDLGFFDADGFLFIKGKIKELIKCKGATISPETIESKLQERLGIAHICAIRIEDGGKPPIDLPAVAIKIPENYTLNEEQIREIANEEMTDDFALTGGIYFVNDFPMTPSGKVKRGALKDLANGWYKEELKRIERERRRHEPAPMFFLS